MNQDRLERHLKKVCGRLGLLKGKYDWQNRRGLSPAEYENEWARYILHACRLDSARGETILDVIDWGVVAVLAGAIPRAKKNPLGYAKTIFKREVTKAWKADQLTCPGQSTPYCPDVTKERGEMRTERLSKQASNAWGWPGRSELLQYAATVRERNIAELLQDGLQPSEVADRIGHSIEEVVQTIYDLSRRGYSARLRNPTVTNYWPERNRRVEPITARQKADIRKKHKQGSSVERLANKYHCPDHVIKHILSE